MAIIKNAELWFAKLDPKRPNKKFNPKNPTWELQLRTFNKDQKKEWEAMGLKVKAVVPDEGEIYFRLNLRKKSLKADGSAANPVEVLGGNLKPLDARKIGNGSIGNVRIYQYEYGDAGDRKLAAMLMGVQVTKHVVYEPPERTEESFEEEEMETVEQIKEMADNNDEPEY